ncbi:hypothetical protein XENOCAPTIV_029196 [Xenoophorus captivus]|uniref:Uncharacterized protein n=1 Tax=Xenoophorus captivus TaxID=1517983 RepID=A0ABV0RKT3_9TELE
MSSRRRPAGGVKCIQGDPSPSGTKKKRVTSEEEINQRRSSRRAVEGTIKQEKCDDEHQAEADLPPTSRKFYSQSATKHAQHSDSFPEICTRFCSNKIIILRCS